MTDSLSPVALSRLTWSADDRQAWDDTYRACLLVAVRRDERAREEALPLAVNAMVGYGRPMFSVHVDVLTDARCPNCGAPSLNDEPGNDCGLDRCADALPVSLRYRDARAAIGDVRYSVHVDCMQGDAS